MALLRFLYSRRSLKRSTESFIPAFPLSRSDTLVSQAQRRPTLPQQLPRPGASRLIIVLPPGVVRTRPVPNGTGGGAVDTGIFHQLCCRGEQQRDPASQSQSKSLYGDQMLEPLTNGLR